MLEHACMHMHVLTLIQQVASISMTLFKVSVAHSTTKLRIYDH